MAEWKSRVGQLTLMLAATVLGGCPISVVTPPQLSATPAAVDFGTNQTVRDLAINNVGGGTLNWTAQEVSRASTDDPWVATDIPWLTLSIESGATTTDLDHITLTADRTGLPSGLQTNTGLQIVSDGGTQTVPVSLLVEAQLEVTPQQFSLSATDNSATFSVINQGTVPLSWTVQYLIDPTNPNSGSNLPPGYSVSPAGGTNQALASTSVTVTFPDEAPDFGLLIRSNSGEEIVQFSIGSALTGLSISPSTLTLSIARGPESDIEQPTSTLSLQNIGTLPISWTLSVRDRINPNASPPITATPILGTTQIGATSAVAVRVSNADTIIEGDGLYEIVVRVGETFQTIPIIVDVLPLPTITLAEPPDTQVLQPPVVMANFLDYGEDLIQQQFYVVNTGSRDSRLFFNITYDEQGQDDALIADVSPIQGNTNGSDRDYFLSDQQVYADGVPIVVTINRNNLVEDLETRTITVRAFETANFTSELTAVEAQTIEIRVAKPPFAISGALNRARAPSMLRFVFSNRDELGRVVPLQTAAEQARVAYEIFENEIPLDLDETSQFVTFDYRGNVVLLLDFTGSMYNAGTTGENPLRPGEAVELMRTAAKSFIDDLPLNFNLQLMFHTDRIPENRIIQRFTNDREQLKDALDRFVVAPALFGDSDIAEAVMGAIQSLQDEDPAGTLPFDDADVRAVVFITDGEETVANTIMAGAEETRTRLFPVAYSPNGDPVRLADLIAVAEDSGGHLYTVGSVRNLSNVFGTRRSLEIVPSSSAVPNTAAFQLRNVGTQAFTYTVTGGDFPWLNSISPTSGSLNGGANQLITVTLDQIAVDSNTSLQVTVDVETSSGDTGEISVEFVATDTDTITDIRTTVRDETGTLWEELNNQSVLTYVTPKEEDFQYLLSGTYTRPDNTVIEGSFERNAVLTLGDPRIGQISLHTKGIEEKLTTLDPTERFFAEVYVYADYIPRNIHSFSVRFMPVAADDLTVVSQDLLNLVDIQVERAPGGLLDDEDDVGTADWRIIPRADGRYDFFADEGNYLPIGSFGNLLKITFKNLSSYVAAFENGARQPEFFLDMRMDNSIYFSPQSEGQPSSTKYFLYPGGIANDGRGLSVALGDSDLASPAQFVTSLSQIPGFDPEDMDALDIDMDGIPDFNDPAPLDEEIPAAQVVPNPIDVLGNQDTFVLTVRNNLLDSFTWNIDTAMLPSWIPATEIRYGVMAESMTPLRATLRPGETERIQFTVDRTGLTPGTAITDNVVFDIFNSEYAFIVPESVSVTMEINP